MTVKAWMPVVAAVAALYGLGQANHDLWLIDEPRDAEIAREMAETGNLAVPTLNGAPFLEKPPLSYAAAALSLKLLPVRPEAAARIPSALFCLGAMACTAWIGTRLLNPVCGLAAAVLLGTSKEFMTIGHECLVDAGLFLWTSLAVAAGMEGDLRDRKRWWLLSAAAMGMAFLSKGLVGVLLPGVGLGAFLLLNRGRRMLVNVPWVWMGLIVAAFATVWLWPLHQRGLLEAYVGDHVRRLGAGAEHSHTWYYYLLRMFEDFAPWSVLLPFLGIWLFRGGRAQARSLALPLAWFLADLLLLSIPSSKRGIYLIPAFPALAILLGAFLAQGGKSGRALLLSSAGVVGIWIWILCIHVPRDNARHSVSVPVREIARATGFAPWAGMGLSEPVRGALAFELGRTFPELPDARALAAWLDGPPAVALVQGTRDLLEKEPLLEGRCTVVREVKLHHERLLFVVSPGLLPRLAGQGGGDR